MPNLESLIRTHIQLDRQGKNYVGVCPFHSEQTASFTVNSVTQTFLCLGCGAKGTALDFKMKIADAKYA